MKPLSEVAPRLLVIQIQIQAVFDFTHRYIQYRTVQYSLSKYKEDFVSWFYEFCFLDLFNLV